MKQTFFRFFHRILFWAILTKKTCCVSLRFHCCLCSGMSHECTELLTVQRASMERMFSVMHGLFKSMQTANCKKKKKSYANSAHSLRKLGILTNCSPSWEKYCKREEWEDGNFNRNGPVWRQIWQKMTRPRLVFVVCCHNVSSEKS